MSNAAPSSEPGPDAARWTPPSGANATGAAAAPEPEPDHPLWHHVGRAWSGTELEDGCPCPKASCGLVVEMQADPGCRQHHPSAVRTMRQRHQAGRCPGPRDQPPVPTPHERAERIRRRLENLCAREEWHEGQLDLTRQRITTERAALRTLLDEIARL